MAYCRYCGAEVRSSDTFCFKCGRPLEVQQQSPAQSTTSPPPQASVATNVTAERQVRELDVIIAPARILAVGIVSFGLYLFYWFYLTWKHYRDYTKTENYPVWHAFTLFVPIYGYFRMHAHVRSFKELMEKTSVPSNLSPRLGVILLIASSALGVISARISLTDPSASTTVLDVISVVINVGLVFYVQTNLNRYWKSLQDIRVINARVGVGEVLFCLVGILAWIGTLFPDTSPLMSG